VISSKTRIHRAAIVAALLIGSVARVTCAAEWKLPENAPLLTRWAKEVSPASALPEYPRPQLARDVWQNLNGLWDYAITGKADERKPDAWNGKILVPYPVESALSGVMKPLKPDQRL